MRPTIPVLVLVIASTMAPARAQEAQWLVGQRVVIRYRRPLTIGSVNVEPKDYRAYTVKRTDRNMLWLVSASISGWVPSDQVMTLDQALDFYTNDIRNNPTDWNSYLYRGFVWDVMNDFDKAIADYTAAIRIYPRWPNTFNNRGWTYHRRKEYDKAIADYNSALRLDPHCVLAIVNRGFAHEDKGEYYKAIDDFNRAIKEDSRYGRAHAALGWVYATCPDKKFRDGKLAVQTATKACEVTQWKDPGKMAVLAAAYAESGAFEKAVRWQKQSNDRYIEPRERRLGQERLALYQDKKPFRAPEATGRGEHRDDAPEAGDPFAQFHDPEQAARIFSELQARIGHPPEAVSGHEHETWERKLTAGVLHVARRHRMKQREIRAIWHAGLGNGSAIAGTSTRTSTSTAVDASTTGSGPRRAPG